MFRHADAVVQFVMLILVAASFVSWTLCVVKLNAMRESLRGVRGATAQIEQAACLADLRDLDRATTAMAEAARREITSSAALIDDGRVEGAAQRVGERIARIEGAALARLREGLPVFASISSVGPFVGLFGTVWGIMHSFAGIGAAKATSLAVVAPGISEALLATALGLVAAIPATIMYNYLLRRLAANRDALATAATLLAGLAAREMETIAVAAARRTGSA
ncbi:biopolymer transport protein ExbB [Sphingomonas endophytica]|uniref:Biopolymer transport protein ExbB n=2 Tax=Sphingomonas endophytica TaxID=869719 RepID=A0ABR6N7R2_9SPHN|nr:biopolymer transport protein ExbB [Sphingomonas endophytica]